MLLEPRQIVNRTLQLPLEENVLAQDSLGTSARKVPGEKFGEFQGLTGCTRGHFLQGGQIEAPPSTLRCWRSSGQKEDSLTRLRLVQMGEADPNRNEVF